MSPSKSAVRDHSSVPPFRLRVLGPVTVRRSSDPQSHSCLTQPRHIAALCYLALARPRGLHSRDTLIALLWPEHDQQHGRRALRNTLYGIRTELGSNAIISAGDNLIGLDPAFVGCDAIDLERGLVPELDATENGATPQVEPMQGLHVPEAREFDEWMLAECERLRALLARHRGKKIDAPYSSRRIHATDASVMYARGHYLFLRNAHGGDTGELLRSRDYFERARSLDARFAPAIAGLANFYAVAARRGALTPFDSVFAQAIALSHEALSLEPTLAGPHVHFAVKSLYLDDDFERAGAEFATAVSLEPEYAEAHRFHGVWLGMANRYDDALREMELAAALEPDIPHMLSSLAAAQLAAGRRIDAEETLRRTLEIDARHQAAHSRLVRLLEEDDRIEEALALRVGSATIADADRFRAAFASQGASGYRSVLHELLKSEAAILEERVMGNRMPTPNEIFSPPIVRLAGTYARLGDWKKVRSWRTQGIAARPALARWFDYEIGRDESKRTSR